MKICLALEKFSKHAGGAESYAVDLAGSLISKGWEAHLVGYEWDGQPESAIFHKLDRPPVWFPSSLKLLHFAHNHRRLVERENFDVVVGFGSTLLMNVYQSHGGVHSLSSKRKLQAIRNPAARFVKGILMLATPKYHVRSWIESAAFRLSPMPKIVAISDMIKQDMTDAFGVPEDRIQVIYNGIDGSRFSRNPDQIKMLNLRKSLGFDDHVLFLFMSYDFRKKGLRFLIEAAGKLRQITNAKFGLVVVGRPPSPSLLRLVRRLGLNGVVAFPGSTKSPQDFYNACDVFALPTFYDACSLVVFEAMSCGLPVITTAYNGASGIIDHGIDGFVMKDPSNTTDLCNSMKKLLDHGVRSQMGDKAFIKSRKYSLEANHESMTRVFMEAAQERKMAPIQ